MQTPNSGNTEPPQPGESEVDQPRILLDILENHIPGITRRRPDLLGQLKRLLTDPATTETGIQQFLQNLQREAPFDADLLFHLLLGIRIVCQEERLLHLNEIDLFLEAHQEMFRKKLKKPMGRKACDGLKLNDKNNQQKLNV